MLKGEKMLIKSSNSPSLDKILEEAKNDASSVKCGMYLTHVGIVREDAKAKVRENKENTKPVVGMEFSYNEEKVNSAIKKLSKWMAFILCVFGWQVENLRSETTL